MASALQKEKKRFALDLVFNKDPEPLEWHLTRNRDDYHLLTVGVTC